MRKRILVAASLLSLVTGGLLMQALGQQAPLPGPLPPAGGGPAAAAAAANFEVPWDKWPQGEVGDGVPKFYVREGYKVTVASDPIPNGARQGRTGQGAEARFMALDDNGNLYVSQPTAGRVVSLKDDGTGKYVLNAVITEGKITAHGMFIKDGWLWFTQSKAVYKVKLTKDGKTDGETVTVLSDLPGAERADGGHWWRPILVVADGFFTAVGDPQNASDQTATERSKIWKYSLDGKTRELWCSGVRNTEKLQLRPGTDELWGCDHGSDNFGSNFKETSGTNQPVTNNYPPDEFNHYVKDGFYGHPFIVGAGLPRPEYANRPDILAIAANTIDPAWDVGPHYANNGWTFAAKDSGVAHKGDVLIGCHGSWNSTMKEGYRIQKVLFDQQTGLPYGAIQLVGTLSPDHKQTLARPVDVLEMPDGSFLFSDDQNNRIWRLSAAKGQTEPK